VVQGSNAHQPNTELENALSWLFRLFQSGIGRKVLVALSGLALVLFLVGHLTGNLLIYSGDDGESMKAYAESLHQMPGFMAIEIGLLLMFVLHISLVLWLTLENRRARGALGYSGGATKQESGVLRFLSSKTMAVSGLIVLAFLVVHISDFRMARGEGDIYTQVTTKLQEPWRMALYVLGSLLASWHVYHGFQSAFRSAGVNHKKYTPLLRTIGTVLSIAFAIGFASIPIWIFVNAS
jgi:succinate dehydrogenase / fumarate reductase cytochrome b subunit